MSILVGLPWRRTPGDRLLCPPARDKHRLCALPKVLLAVAPCARAQGDSFPIRLQCLQPLGPLCLLFQVQTPAPAPAAAQMGLPWGCGRPSLTGHAWGLLTSLVTLLLLQLGSAQLRVEGPGQAVTATVGQDVVLPCHLSPRKDARTLDVRWIRDQFSETVHHYRKGEDLYGEQMGAYAGRTELARDGLSAGSLDLRITALRPSDDGQYFCTVKNADAYDEATVDLEVSATGTDPHLSLVGYEAGGVRVLCRSAGWYPLPQLLWRDARGQHLPSVSQTHSQDQEGLFEIKGAVIVTRSVEGPLSCVVRSSRLQQERESSLNIAAPFFLNAQPFIVVLVLVLVLLAVSIGLGVYLFRKKGKLAAQGWSGGRCSAGTRVGLERAAQSQQLGESLQSLPPAPGEVVSLREGLGWSFLCLRGRQCFLTPERTGIWVFARDDKLLPLTINSFFFCFPEKQAAELANERATLEKQAAELAWRKFLLPQNTVKVTLDPCTAHPQLILSEDNRRVRFQSEQQQLPYSLDRFDSWCCVLGHEEFEEGRHCWLVEVEGKLEKYFWWGVGVAWASVTKNGFYKMTPEEGIWAVRYQQGQLKSLTLPRTPLSLSPVPTRIWVCLDCTQQQVSFINADNGVEIFKFMAANFNKKPIRPWFLLWTQGIQLCLRDSTPQTLSPALGDSCPSPATPASPLLGPAGAAQE
ncbi:butyrophilin subfamily 1 member A1-like [Anser cygnoides]|uniref:butyrophilin subfamily 1 member A1-like n=1 Tax=Anser cygnoides TaxID=8845 RepID=UPI0034D15502